MDCPCRRHTPPGTDSSQTGRVLTPEPNCPRHGTAETRERAELTVLAVALMLAAQEVADQATAVQVLEHDGFQRRRYFDMARAAKRILLGAEPATSDRYPYEVR